MTNSEYCYKCGQARSTHDDGECEAVNRSMSVAARRVGLPVPSRDARPGAQEIAQRLAAMAEVARGTATLAGYAWLDEQLDALKEMVALEAWKIDHNGRAQDNG